MDSIKKLSRFKFITRILIPILVSVSQIQLAFGSEIKIAETYSAIGDITTDRPIIGVLSQVLLNYERFVDQPSLHIVSSYVKWIESAGGRVMPILLCQNDSYYEKVFEQTNGLLFPGGDNKIDPNIDTPMISAAKKLYKLAVDANNRGDHYPIWGTCLGFELLTVLGSGINALEACEAPDVSDPLEFVARGKLFSELDYYGEEYVVRMMNSLKSSSITYNHHSVCLTDRGFDKANLRLKYRPLAYSSDTKGNRYIAILESYRYPFYGVQFHPEKNPFEFNVKKSQKNIIHTIESIAVSRFFADVFVSEARKNRHTVTDEEVQTSLIYSHQAMFTTPKNDTFMQRYIFALPCPSSLNELYGYWILTI